MHVLARVYMHVRAHYWQRCPPGAIVAKCLFFLALFENPNLEVTATYGATVKNFHSFLSHSFILLPVYIKMSGEKMGQKVNVNLFMVDLYMMGNRIHEVSKFLHILSLDFLGAELFI